MSPQELITENWSSKHAWFALTTARDAKAVLFDDIFYDLSNLPVYKVAFPNIF